MKKIIVSAFALAITSSAIAQITSGSIFLGLNLGFGSQNYESSSTMGSTTVIDAKVKSSSWNLGPTAQYFFADNMSAGLGFSIGGSRWENRDPSDNDEVVQTMGTFGLNIFARKYFTCAETFYTFGELNLGMSSGNGKSEYHDGQSNTTTTFTNEDRGKSAAINFGFAWMATPRVMMQGSFGVLSFNTFNNRDNINAAGDNYDRWKGSGFNFALSSGNIPFNLGFAYRINGGGE
jgi:hypothetical protein